MLTGLMLSASPADDLATRVMLAMAPSSLFRSSTSVTVSREGWASVWSCADIEMLLEAELMNLLY